MAREPSDAISQRVRGHIVPTVIVRLVSGTQAQRLCDNGER